MIRAIRLAFCAACRAVTGFHIASVALSCGSARDSGMICAGEQQGAEGMRRINDQPVHDFTTVLMLAAIAGAVSQVIRAILDVGKSAGWWP
jgi:hypothetical protein